MKPKIVHLVVGLNLIVAFISIFVTATVPSYYTSTGFELRWRALPLIIFVTIAVISIGLFTLIKSHERVVIMTSLISFLTMVAYIVVNDFAYGKILLLVLLGLDAIAFIWLFKTRT